jgi:hypothetical protein
MPKWFEGQSKFSQSIHAGWSGGGNFRLLMGFSPIWDMMSREYADVATDLLRKYNKVLVDILSKKIEDKIKARLSSETPPTNYTGNLSESLSSKYVPAMGKSPSGKLTGNYTAWKVVVGPWKKTTPPSPSVGRPVEKYIDAMEFGGLPAGNAGQAFYARLANWGKERGIPREDARIIAGVIRQKGSQIYWLFSDSAQEVAEYAEDIADNTLQYWAESTVAKMSA